MATIKDTSKLKTIANYAASKGCTPQNIYRILKLKKKPIKKVVIDGVIFVKEVEIN